MLVTIALLIFDLLEVVIVSESRLDASLDHPEVGLLERLRDIGFCINLLHPLVDLSRLELAHV